jgi:MFS family permease
MTWRRGAPTALRVRLAFTIVLASTATAGLAGARLIVPVVALALGANVLLVGIIGSLFSAIPMLFSVAFGRWVDRRGTALPLIVGAGLVATAGFAAVLLPLPHTLLLTAALVGAGAIITHIAATRAVGEFSPREDRSRNLGLLVLSHSVAQFIGPAVSGIAFEDFGIRFAFGFIGSLGLVIIVGWAFAPHNYLASAGIISIGQARPRIRDLTAMPELRKWLIISGTFMAVVTTFPFTVALHSSEVGISAADAGLVLGAFAAGMFVARLVVSVTNRRVKPTRMVFWSLLLGCGSYAVLPFTREFETFLAASAVCGLLLGMGAPLTLGLIYDAAPDERVNEAVGMSLTVSNTLQTAMPVAMGALAAQFGMGTVAWAMAASLFATALYARR